MLAKGNLLADNDGVVGLICGLRRCGHQYDRHWEYELLDTTTGILRWVDEYDLYRRAGFKVMNDRALMT